MNKKLDEYKIMELQNYGIINIMIIFTLYVTIIILTESTSTSPTWPEAKRTPTKSLATANDHHTVGFSRHTVAFAKQDDSGLAQLRYGK